MFLKYYQSFPKMAMYYIINKTQELRTEVQKHTLSGDPFWYQWKSHLQKIKSGLEEYETIIFLFFPFGFVFSFSVC
jgi:hypothetical protein